MKIPDRFRPVPEEGAAEDSGIAADEGPGLGSVLLLAVVALLLAAGAVLARRRLRAPVEPSAADRARAEARRALDAGADPADVLAGWLAARLGCAPAAVISPDLESRLRAAGESRERAATLAALQERLVAARYGGAPPGDDDLATLRTLLGPGVGRN